MSLSLNQVQEGANALLALTRNEDIRDDVFKPSSFDALPQQIRNLNGINTADSNESLFLSQHGIQSPNALFGVIQKVYYYSVNAVLETFYTNVVPATSDDTNFPLSGPLKLFDTALRLINNSCFVTSLIDGDDASIVPQQTFTMLQSALPVFELVLNSTHYVSATTFPSSILTKFQTKWLQLQTTTNNSSSPNHISMTNSQLVILMPLYITVVNSAVEHYREIYDAVTTITIPTTLLSGLATHKFEDLPLNYQLLYFTVMLVIIYIKATGFTPLPVVQSHHRDPVITMATIQKMLLGMTQLTIAVVPHTSTTATIAHSLQHPFLISVKPLTTALVELFTPINAERQFTPPSQGRQHQDADFFVQRQWVDQFQQNFSNSFSKSPIFGSDQPPAWISANTTSSIPNITTLFFLIISTPCQPDKTTTSSLEIQPTATPDIQCIATLLKDPLNTQSPVSTQIKTVLLHSIPLLLGLMSDFTANQIHTCFNHYVAPESTQAPIITNPHEPQNVPQNNSLKKPDLSPQEQKLQQARAQTSINNAISNYFMSTTPFIVSFLSGLSVLRRQDEQKIISPNASHISQLFESFRHSYIQDSITMMDQYELFEEGVEPTLELAISYLNTSLEETCPSLKTQPEPKTVPKFPLPSAWDENLIGIAKLAATRDLSSVPSDGEYEDDETNALVVLQRHIDSSTSPLLALASLIKSMTTAIMLAKFINIPSSGKPLTQAQIQKQQQSVTIVASDSTPLLNTQQHFNYLIRHIYPFLFAELITQITTKAQWYANQFQSELSNIVATQTNQAAVQSATINLLLLQTLLQRSVVYISDIFTALAPIGLSALPCQFFLHSTQPMITILTLFHTTISYFLQIPINQYLPVMFPLLNPGTKMAIPIADTLPVFTAFEDKFAAIHPKPKANTGLLKILSSLCYRALTLVGYFMGNALPPTNPALLQQHPQLAIITRDIMSPTSVFVSMHYTYYYLQHFVYKKTTGDFKLNPTNLIKVVDDLSQTPSSSKTGFKQSFQYQLLLNFDPPIIEVIEGILTLMLNSSLYFQRKPFTNDIPTTLNRLGQQQQSQPPSADSTPTQSSPSPSSQSPLVLIVHPLSLIFTPIPFSFLLRLLTLGWDGDDERYGDYLDPATQTLVTPGAHTQPESIQRPKEMKLIHSIFHQLFSQAHTASLEQSNQEFTPLTPDVASLLIQSDFIASPLDSIPSHVLHHKLPNFQAPTLRLLRCAFDTLSSHFTKPVTVPIVSTTSNAIINVPVSNNVLLTPYFNVLTPLRVAELITSLYALTKFCPIPTLRYESARTFSYMAQLFSAAQKQTTIDSAANRLVQLSTLIDATQGTNGIPSSWVPGPFDTGAIYLERSFQNGEAKKAQKDVSKLTQDLLSGVISLESFAKLVQFQPDMSQSAPTSTSTISKPIPKKGPMKAPAKKETVSASPEQQTPPPKLFQDLLQILLMNSVTADGQMLIQEAHSALQALQLAP